MRYTLALAGLAALLAVTPAPTATPQPSDPIALVARNGKSASDLTFVALDGTGRSFATSGRPTVVIAFASWCAACMAELPRTIADYERYKDRVDFLGIDYQESPNAAKLLVARYNIPFPVESFAPAATALPQAARETFTVSDAMTRAQILDLQNALPPALFQKVLAVYDARATMGPDAFAAYEKSMGVSFESPASIAADLKAHNSGAAASLTLPHAFVIDANGIVTAAIEGYTPAVDQIALALVKLGLK